jgi:hypothetical protein
MITQEMTMNALQAKLRDLPTIALGGRPHLSYQAVTDTVAAFLYPTVPLDAAAYQRVLETADALCRELGYAEVVRLTPPDVALAAAGLYWTVGLSPAAGPPLPADTTTDLVLIHAGPGPAELLAEGQLLDARLGRLGLDEVSRQHFKIPVTASEDVADLLHRAVASAWPNDYKGLWYDVLGMCIRGGADVSPTRRQFTVIIRGLERRYWRFQADVQPDSSGAPYLYISLVEEANRNTKGLFPLGQVVMTPGVAALEIDPTPYIARHHQGDWGQLDAFDRRQNETAVKEGLRILSAYDVPTADGETVRLWVITEADRSVTTALLPNEY